MLVTVYLLVQVAHDLLKDSDPKEVICLDSDIASDSIKTVFVGVQGNTHHLYKMHYAASPRVNSRWGMNY